MQYFVTNLFINETQPFKNSCANRLQISMFFSLLIATYNQRTSDPKITVSENSEINTSSSPATKWYYAQELVAHILILIAR